MGKNLGDVSDIELTSISVRMDGRASIEHQIDIHVQDLSQLGGDFTLDEIIQGLKYVMDYRIKGKKMPNFELSLMKRLLDSLLPHMGGRQGKMLFQTPTPEADLTLQLFGDFLQEVVEFRIAVSQISASDLRHALKLHRRCHSRATQEQKELAVSIIGLLTSSFPQFSDWKELVKESSHDEVERLLNQYPDLAKQPVLPYMEKLLPPPALYFDKNVEKLAEMFGSSTEKGLLQSKVVEHTHHYGTNKLPEGKKITIWQMLWTQITDFMILILLVVATVEAATEDIRPAIVLYAVVVFNVFLGFTQEYKASKALAALMTLSVPKATVIREGRQEVIDALNLVPGDIVVLEEGDSVPADLRLCEVAQLEIIEAILTGESLPVMKNTRTIKKRTRKLPLADCKGNAFMSTVVARGRGKGIVVRTGSNSEIGRISQAIVQQPNQKTPIQVKLDRLGKILVAISIALCVVFVVIGVLWKRDAVEMVKLGISLAVSVIPEGLVAVVTVTTALGVRRMAAENAIVRKLASVETLGSVTVICSDKTGTLTEGKMGTNELWTTDNATYSFTESTSLDPAVGRAHLVTSELTRATSPLSNHIDEASSSLIISTMIASLCNNSSVVYDDKKESYIGLGDPTEVAMITAAQKAGFTREMFMENFGLSKVSEFAFDSERKMMSSVFRRKSTNGHFIFCKGAPETILKRSVGYLSHISQTGTEIMNALESQAFAPISEDFLELVASKSSKMASGGLRVLGLSMRVVSNEEANQIIESKKATEAEKDLIFVGLIGLIDPPKEGVAESITSCKRAGIRVIMITGDHIATATAIAQQLGIIDPNNPYECRAMKGYEVDLMNDETLAAVNPFPVVFARVGPDTKLKIVRALQSQGNFVSMTGDGVNDAPAIKKADVGVAMGIGGTEITKQAADIVLSDDNFTTIVKAVKEGRRVFDNIKKFIVYLLSCNSAEIFLFLLSAIFNADMPLTVMHVLWANLIADIPPAMSLGVEPFEKDIMDRPPRPPKQAILTFRTWILILAQGFIQCSVTFIIFVFTQSVDSNSPTIIKHPNAFLHATHPTEKEQRSLAFLVLVSMQLVQSFYSRSVQHSVFKTGIFGNKWLIGAFFLSFGLLVMGYYTPGMNDFLELSPLKGVSWAVVFIALLLQLLIVEAFKWAYRYTEDRTQHIQANSPIPLK